MVIEHIRQITFESSYERSEHISAFTNLLKAAGEDMDKLSPELLNIYNILVNLPKS